MLTGLIIGIVIGFSIRHYCWAENFFYKEYKPWLERYRHVDISPVLNGSGKVVGYSAHAPGVEEDMTKWLHNELHPNHDARS